VHSSATRDNSETKTPGIHQKFQRHSPVVLLPVFCFPILCILAKANLHGANDSGHIVYSSTLTPSPASDKALVNLDRMLAADAIALWSNHARPKLVEDLECRLVSSEGELPLELQGGLASSLGRNQISAPEPNRECGVRRLHHSASCQ